LPATGAKATKRLAQKMTAQIQIVTGFRAIDLRFIVSSIPYRQPQWATLAGAGEVATNYHTASGRP